MTAWLSTPSIQIPGTPPMFSPRLQQLVDNSGSLGTVVCDWSTGGTLSVSGSAGTTATLDTAVPFAGLPSLRINIGAVGTLQVTFTFTSPITVAQLKTLQLATRFTRNSTADGASAVLAAPTLWLTGASGSQWRYSLDTAGWRANTWRTWSVAPGAVAQGWSFGGVPLPTSTASMDTDTIVSARLVYAVNAIDAGETFWLGAIFSGARRAGRISIVLDGCYTSQDTHILPMLRSQGLRASLAVVNSLVGQSGSFDWQTLAKHYSNGHNVLHHTFDASGGKTGGYVNAANWPTASSITADVTAGFANLSARGFTRGIGYGVWGYVLPWAVSTGATRQQLVTDAVIAGGMLAMRNGAVAGGSYTRLQPIAHASMVDPLSIQGAIQISNSHTAQDVKDVIDRARDRGEWGIITVHRSVLSAPAALEMTHANCDDWISYLGAQARTGVVECLPFDAVCVELGI